MSLLLVLPSASSGGGSSVTVDNTLVGEVAAGGGGTAIALSGFSTGGANRLVLVAVDHSNGGAGNTVTSVTASGLTFSLVTPALEKWPGYGKVYVWGAIASSQQTNKVITVNLSAGDSQVSARTFSFSGTITTSVDDAIGEIATAYHFSSGNPTTVNLTTTAANSLVVSALGITGSGSVTAGSNQTKDGTTTAASFTQISTMRQNSVTASSGTSVTSNATLGASEGWGLIALELLKGTSDTVTTRTQTGVSRITAAVTRDQTGKGRVTATATRDQTGLSRVTLTVPRTTIGLSRITATATRTIQGTSRILVTVPRTQMGISNIVAPASGSGSFFNFF